MPKFCKLTGCQSFCRKIGLIFTPVRLLILFLKLCYSFKGINISLTLLREINIIYIVLTGHEKQFACVFYCWLGLYLNTVVIHCSGRVYFDI